MAANDQINSLHYKYWHKLFWFKVMEKFGHLRDLKLDIHEWHYEFLRFKSRENNVWHSSDNNYRNILKSQIVKIGLGFL